MAGRRESGVMRCSTRLMCTLGPSILQPRLTAPPLSRLCYSIVRGWQHRNRWALTAASVGSDNARSLELLRSVGLGAGHLLSSSGCRGCTCQRLCLARAGDIHHRHVVYGGEGEHARVEAHPSTARATKRGTAHESPLPHRRGGSHISYAQRAAERRTLAPCSPATRMPGNRAEAAHCSEGARRTKETMTRFLCRITRVYPPSPTMHAWMLARSTQRGVLYPPSTIYSVPAHTILYIRMQV